MSIGKVLRILLTVFALLTFEELCMADKISIVIENINKNRIDFELTNGLKVVLFNVNDAKTINTTIGFNAGSLYENKPGLAYLTAQSLVFKNKKYKMLEIPQIIESLGGSITTSAGHDISTITVKALYEDTETVLLKVLDILNGFEVDNEVLNILKPNIISEIKVKDDDAWDFTRKTFLKEIYGDHPYGREPEGDERGILSITPDDIMTFFRNLYTPDNAVLVVVGKMNTNNLKKFIEEHFSKWTGKKKPMSAPEIRTKKDKKEVRINKNLKQSTIRLGHLSTNIKDKNSMELKILNFILGGGGFGSRLMERIREKEGLAYGVFSNFYIERTLNGYFFVGTQTENKNVSRTIDIITNEIKKIIEEGITDKELEDTKNFSKGSLLLGMESFSTIASFLVSEKMFGLDKNYFIKDIQKISVIKKEDIQRVAREYIDINNLTIVIVGGE
ncbi:MAG: pitrilysin family protein [Spirochaetia bacterium]|nr:insulinase family protein [Spirochaetota bacterium]MCX8097115.1 insulinase family protein [Spirochaetota bacterium]MDW8112115.1 pitrilysin family protein [Spirochaetia bacterium]